MTRPGEGDPPTDDELYSALADEIEQIDAMIRERLGGGELDRRRKAIMDRVRNRNDEPQQG